MNLRHLNCKEYYIEFLKDFLIIIYELYLHAVARDGGSMRRPWPWISPTRTDQIATASAHRWIALIFWFSGPKEIDDEQDNKQQRDD